MAPVSHSIGVKITAAHYPSISNGGLRIYGAFPSFHWTSWWIIT